MPADMFLKLDGIPGESQGHKHKGEIEVLSYSWGISNQAPSSGGGGGAGKPVVQDFTIVKQLDAASPKLMEACCRGEHLGNAMVTLVSKEGQQDYFKIKMSDVLISSYQTSGGSGGGSVPMEQVSFTFSHVDLQAADRKGQFVSQVSCSFTRGGDGQIGHEHD